MIIIILQCKQSFTPSNWLTFESLSSIPPVGKNFEVYSNSIMPQMLLSSYKKKNIYILRPELQSKLEIIKETPQSHTSNNVDK